MSCCKPYMSSSLIKWKIVVHGDSKCPVLAVCVVLQEGRYVAGVQSQPIQNVSGYNVFPFTDLPYQYDLDPVLGTCSTNNSG